ncbi:MAG: NAD(P)H-binding protein [Chloroflexota bacterium]|nr:NAD(P)H-binding protein [Chloroflexota bacterium]MDE2853283.1 NAD(P)H-binding protein [Chloroflexota bacterium]MDE2948190.1 NAD(P)H-binding protein [Chloroflexota bacterium]
MILITGATGLVGRHLIRRLMRESLPTRVLLPERRMRRLPWDAADPQAPELFAGDVLDEEAFFRAVTGCHAVIHLENAQWWGRRRDLEQVELSGARALASVARAARVGRIITVSHLGAAPSSAYALHRVKGEVEDLLRNSGVAYTVIRSGIIFAPDDAFINHVASMLRINPAFFLMPGHGEVVLHPIYIDDLVEAIYRSLDRVRLVDSIVEIGGPEYVSLRDLILTIMRVTGMRRPVIGVPPYLLRWITSVYSRILPRSLMTAQWLDILAANRTAPLGGTYDYFGFQPRRFEDTLLRYLPQRAHFMGLLRDSFRPRPRRS